MPSDGINDARVVIDLAAPRSTMPYATWASRVAALVIDLAPAGFVLLIGYVLGRPMYSLETQSLNGHSYEVTVSSGPGLAYFLGWAVAILFVLWNKGLREGASGQSLGKSVLGLTTVSIATGEPPGPAHGILRAILLWVDFVICYLGVLWPLWDEKRQCLVSDKATGTIVVRGARPGGSPAADGD